MYIFICALLPFVAFSQLITKCSNDIQGCLPHVGFSFIGTESNHTMCLQSNACNYTGHTFTCNKGTTLSVKCSMTYQKCPGLPYYTISFNSDDLNINQSFCFLDGFCSDSQSFDDLCPAGQSSNLALILGIAGGAVVVVVLVVIGIVCVRKRRQKGERLIEERN